MLEAASTSSVAITQTTSLSQTPTIVITSDRQMIKYGQSAAISFVLSESSSTFQSDDISVVGGSIFGFSGSGSSYYCTFVPKSGFVGVAVISVRSGSFSNSSGNLNSSTSFLRISVDAVSSYGTLTIQDGVYVPAGSPRENRNAPVRMAGEVLPFAPINVLKSSDLKTFSVEIFRSESKNVYLDGDRVPTKVTTQYSKKYDRISPEKNLAGRIKKFVAPLAGCNEAIKLRRRLIALSRMRNSISNETFRFGVERS